ncbi:MAG: MarR family transcriptional regulator [Kofleriaceae bacterium]
MSAPDPRLFLALDRAAHRVRAQRERLCRDQLGISAAQLAALLFLARHDGARSGDLAEALAVQAAAVTGLVDRMARDGLVRRRTCPDDARAHRVHLTAAGRRAAAGGHAIVAAGNAALAARFSKDELATVARFLAEVGELTLAVPAHPPKAP